MEEEENIERVTIDYFRNIFTCSNLTDLYYVLDSVNLCIKSDGATFLQEPFTKEKVLESLHQIHPTRSPNPDGMPILFFHKYCE